MWELVVGEEEGPGQNNGGPNQAEIPIRAHAIPTLNNLHSGIVQPDVVAENFELKPEMFHMLQTIGQFNGLPSEDPNLHLQNFIDVADTFKIRGVTSDALKMKLFPYSLTNKAKAWLNSLQPQLIRSWEELADKFLLKFFPPMKAAQYRNDISTFKQFQDESFYEAWEKFKDLLRKCPNHGIPEWIQMETFYNGLNGPTKGMVDASSGGAILEKTYTEAYAILERMEVNNYQWPVERSSLIQKKDAGVWELDAVSALSAQISALNNSIKTMSLSAEAKPVNALTDVISCVFCNSPHIYDNCPQNPQSVCFIGNFNRNNNPYSNTYNPGWRNHPNLSYSQGQHHGQQQGQQQSSSDTAGRSYKGPYPPGFT
ncbi:uncharacterized protein LOC133310023 [Gastrolobium bilobum]|uniref:uncharacterized protein LOC133310023 n=1 Tax=Gastrolobium bilobum TaxID=150636 RepID=UPI002AB1EFD6|nr:uncharacterized protein LOC133310023 [Gastrolobium bilobum]